MSVFTYLLFLFSALRGQNFFPTGQKNKAPTEISCKNNNNHWITRFVSKLFT